MDLWQILVLGVIRMTLEFKLSTIKENIPLLSEELLTQINAVIASHGHKLIKKKEEREKFNFL